MKTSTTKINLLSAAFLLFFSASAMALPVAGVDKVMVSYGAYHGLGGGEFLIDVIGKGANIDYVSFCLEKNENINPNGTTKYLIESVEDYANKGGVGGAFDGKDELRGATKWVMWNWYTGTFGSRSASLAMDIQQTIWMLENEITGYTSNIYRDALLNENTPISGVVKVLNLMKADNNGKFVEYAQSQLIAEPVPEPATMLLFGTGIAGLAGMIRRRRMHH